MPLFFSHKSFDNTSSYKDIQINELPKLHRVALKGKLQKVRELVESTVENINRKDKFGRTALHYAAANGKAPVVEFLLRRHHHVVVDPRDEASMTPLHKAIEEASIGCVTCLIDRRADVDAKDRLGNHLLHTAVSLGNLEICNQLVESNADVSVKNQNGQTPLHISAELGYCHIMSLLIFHHANINQQDNLGRTPLATAAYVGKITSVRLLVRHGAIVGIEDNEGNDAIMAAEQSKKKCVVEYLKSLPPDQRKAKDIPLPIAKVPDSSKINQFEEKHYSSIKLPEHSHHHQEANRKILANPPHYDHTGNSSVDTKAQDASNEFIETPATVSSSICHETMQDLHKVNKNSKRVSSKATITFVTKVFVKADKKVTILEAENLKNLKRAEESESLLSAIKSTLEDELETAKCNLLNLEEKSKRKEEDYKTTIDETLEKCHKLELEITKYSSYIKLKESKMDADIDKRRQIDFERIASLQQGKERLEQYLEVSQNKIKCLEDETRTVRELNDTLKFASRSREMLNNKIGEADTTMANLRNDVQSLEAERKILIEENRKLKIREDEINYYRDKVKLLEKKLVESQKEKDIEANSSFAVDQNNMEKVVSTESQVYLNEFKALRDEIKIQLENQNKSILKATSSNNIKTENKLDKCLSSNNGATSSISISSVSQSTSKADTNNNNAVIGDNNASVNNINDCKTCNQEKLIKKMQIDMENADEEIEKQDLQIEDYQRQIINLKSNLLTMCSINCDYIAGDDD